MLDVVRLRGGPQEVAAPIVSDCSPAGRDVAIGLPQNPGQAGKHQVAWLTGRLAGYRVMASAETGAKLTPCRCRWLRGVASLPSPPTP